MEFVQAPRRHRIVRHEYGCGSCGWHGAAARVDEAITPDGHTVTMWSCPSCNAMICGAPGDAPDQPHFPGYRALAKLRGTPWYGP